METIADIVAEMRAKTAKSKDEAWYDKEKWRKLCQRIEMAALNQRVKDMDEAYNKGYGEAEFDSEMVTKCNQPGNVAKMRDALEQIKGLSYEYFFEAIGKADPEVYLDKCGELANAALSESLRNCDLYNMLEEARSAFLENYEPDSTNYSAIKFIFWLFAEAKGDAK